MRIPSQSFVRVARDNWTLEETETGDPFVPFGCNYYNAQTGWPPQVWGRFNRAAVKQDFRLMEDLGVNAIRLWLQWSAFMPTEGSLSAESLDHCREILLLAAESGIRVNLTGPEFWEGTPSWFPPGRIKGYHHFVDPFYLEAHAAFWEQFASHIASEPVVYGFDLVNEPFMPWDGEVLRKLWNRWLAERYETLPALREAWGKSSPRDLQEGTIPPPPNRRVPGSRFLLDYQTFREEMAFRWIRGSVNAIRRVDLRHLITVGLHQSGFPLEEIIPSRYTAFNPHLLRDCLDYVSLHWYPFGNPLTASMQPFDLPGNLERSLSIFLANCRYHFVGKPLIMEEFSYYGGGAPQFWGGVLPYRTEEEQDDFSRRLLEVSKGSLGGWLNWPLQDTEDSTDTSSYGGLYTAAGSLKRWGTSFRRLSGRVTRKRPRRRQASVTLSAGRTDLLTDWTRCKRLLGRCFALHRRGTLWDFDTGSDFHIG
jgi:hypothetical protein